MWLIFALLASLLWGLNYVLAERLFQNKISPTTILGVEMLAGAVTLLSLSWNKLSTELPHAYKNHYWLLLSAIISMVLGNLLIAMSIQNKNAALAGLVEISYPFFILLFSYLLFQNNQLTLSVFVGGTLIFAGVFVIYFFNK